MGGRRLLIVAQKGELLLIVVASFGQVTDGCLKAEYAMALAWFIFSSLVQSNYPNQEVWSWFDQAERYRSPQSLLESIRTLQQVNNMHAFNVLQQASQGSKGNLSRIG